MIGTILVALLKANLAAGAGVLLVLAARRFVRAWFGARAAYALWLAPLATAVAVLLPHPQIATPISPMVLSAQTAVANVAETFTAQAPAAAQAAGPDVATGAFGLWLAGALAAAALVLWRQARFTRAMGRLTASDTPQVYRAESANVGPAVVGVFRPRIVAPADFEVRFGPQERSLILAHERVHLAGGDAGVNALACAAQCVSWFNPLVHLGVGALRIDQELACDAAVVGRFPQARRAYAELLLKTQIAAHPLPLGCHWPAGADHPLKERIAMLKSPLPAGALRATGLAVACALTLSAGGLAWAAQPTASAGPGPAERAEALKQLAAHPDYSCDPALEAKGSGCKIIPMSAWLALPTPRDVARAYPASLQTAGQTAKVQVHCKVTTKGLLKACEVLHVNLHVPDGEGAAPAALDAFGNAALQLARYYQVRVPTQSAREGHATFYLEIGEFNGVVTPAGGPPAPPTAQRHAKTPVSYAPGSYTPPPGFAEPRTNAPSTQPAAFHSIWIRKPTGDDMARLYPAEAVAKGLTGDVTMSCKVGADGRLNGCTIDRATVSGDSGPAPAADPGFGAATLELAKLFQMEPTNRLGAPTAGTEIRIPVRFALRRPPQPVSPS